MHCSADMDGGVGLYGGLGLVSVLQLGHGGGVGLKGDIGWEW